LSGFGIASLTQESPSKHGAERFGYPRKMRRKQHHCADRTAGAQSRPRRGAVLAQCLASFRRSLALLLLAAAAACGNGSPQHAPLPHGTVVLAFGDSVTYGTGASAGEDYPARLAALTGWEVVNGGIPGDTAARAVSRIAGELDAWRPALAIIELGGNDFLQRRRAADVKQDLAVLIAAARDANAVPVLVGVPELSLLRAAAGRLKDSPIYAALGAEERVLVIDGALADVLSDARLRADAIHPNADGYAVMAERIADGLARAGLLRR
jgi:acyl-CoA thioesterase I